MTAAMRNSSSTTPAAARHAYSASTASGSVTSWIQRGTTTGGDRAGRGPRAGGSSLLRRFAHAPRAREYAPCPTRPRPSSSSATSSAASAAARCSALLPALRERHAADVRRGQRRERRRRPRDHAEDRRRAVRRRASTSITLGNHAYHRREIYRLPRRAAAHPAPGQLPARRSPGTASCVVERDGVAARRRQPVGQRLPARRARRRSRRSTRSSAASTAQRRPRARRHARRGDEREGRASAGTSTAA